MISDCQDLFTDKSYWELHIYKYMRDGQRQQSIAMDGETYLELHNSTIELAPRIHLEMCVTDDGSVCGDTVFYAVDPIKGPFSLECLSCGLHAGPHDTVEDLAKAWNREVIARKVLADL